MTSFLWSGRQPWLSLRVCLAAEILQQWLMICFALWWLNHSYKVVNGQMARMPSIRRHWSHHSRFVAALPMLFLATNHCSVSDILLAVTILDLRILFREINEYHLLKIKVDFEASSLTAHISQGSSLPHFLSYSECFSCNSFIFQTPRYKFRKATLTSVLSKLRSLSYLRWAGCASFTPPFGPVVTHLLAG